MWLFRVGGRGFKQKNRPANLPLSFFSAAQERLQQFLLCSALTVAMSGVCNCFYSCKIYTGFKNPCFEPAYNLTILYNVYRQKPSCFMPQIGNCKLLNSHMKDDCQMFECRPHFQNEIFVQNILPQFSPLTAHNPGVIVKYSKTSPLTVPPTGKNNVEHQKREKKKKKKVTTTKVTTMTRTTSEAVEGENRFFKKLYFMIKGFFFAAFYYMRDKENKPMHIDEILLEAPKHGYRCWVYTYNVNTCLVPNYTLVGGNCTPWQKHLCQFHREKTGGSKCHRFECKKNQSLFLSLSFLFTLF